MPRLIVINEMLPKLWRDPSYLERRGYGGRGNALRRLKIDFPDKHAIYMCDTNQTHLFAREQRALSHGCVRLERPNEVAAALLGTRVADVESKFATGNTRTERVPGDIPVNLAYFPGWPDDMAMCGATRTSATVTLIWHSQSPKPERCATHSNCGHDAHHSGAVPESP